VAQVLDLILSRVSTAVVVQLHCRTRPIASMHYVGTCQTLIQQIAQWVFLIGPSDQYLDQLVGGV